MDKSQTVWIEWLDRDEYGTVHNTSSNYKTIALLLKISQCSALFIAWTDEEGSQFDILFTYRPRICGPVQGGLYDATLFISIIRRGAFGFDVNGTELSTGYVAEKLNLDNNITTEKLTELLNGVRGCLL